MKSTVETLTPTRVKLTVEVPFEELAPSLEGAYKRIAANVSIPGFRKGKVPARIIDQRVGRAAVLEEALQEAMPKAYDEAVRENELRVLGQPAVEISELKEGEPLSFTAEVDVRPEFDLPDYKALPIRVADIESDDEAIETQLNELRARFATLRPVERASAAGDLLLVDIAGAIEGEPLDDLQAKAMSYELGTDGLLPGFDDAVTGAAPGEERAFVFSPDGGPLNGTAIDVAVTVQQVRERDLPAADDDFAQLASEFDTIDELRGDLRSRVERTKRIEQAYAARQKVEEVLMNSVEIELPENIISEQVEAHFADGHGDGDDEHRAEVDTNTRRAMKAQFVLDRIAEVEDVEVSEGELSQWLVSQAPRYGMDPQQFANELVQAGQVPAAVAEVRRAKALELVLLGARVTDESGNEINIEELMNPMGSAAQLAQALAELDANAEADVDDDADGGLTDEVNIEDESAAK